MAKSGEKWGKVGKSSEKWEKVGKSGEKLEKVGGNGKKWEKVGKSGEKWGKVGKSGERWRKMGKSWKKLGKVGKSGESWGKVVFLIFECPKITFDHSSCHFRSIRNYLFFLFLDKMAILDWTTMSVIELVRDIWINNAWVKFEERSLNPSKVIALTTKL